MDKKPKEPFLAIIWSLILPGLGQIYSGRLMRGLVFLFVQPICGILIFMDLINKDSKTSPVLFLILILCTLFGIYILIDSYYCSRAYNVINNLDRKMTAGKRFLYIVGIIILIVFINPMYLIAKPISLYLKENVVEPFKIPSSSMSPTILVGDRVFADKSVYKNSDPQRGDIVIFIDPKDRKLTLDKRVVGLPNETIEIKDGAILINSTPLTDPEIFQKIYYYNRGNYGTEGQSVKIPDNSYFVLGDNSVKSFDSRYFGFIPRTDILGKIYKIFYPCDRSGPIKNIENQIPSSRSTLNTVQVKADRLLDKDKLLVRYDLISSEGANIFMFVRYHKTQSGFSINNVSFRLKGPINDGTSTYHLTPDQGGDIQLTFQFMNKKLVNMRMEQVDKPTAGDTVIKSIVTSKAGYKIGFTFTYTNGVLNNANVTPIDDAFNE